jgi:hypothetical protein
MVVPQPCAFEPHHLLSLASDVVVVHHCRLQYVGNRSLVDATQAKKMKREYIHISRRESTCKSAGSQAMYRSRSRALSTLWAALGTVNLPYVLDYASTQPPGASSPPSHLATTE